jgi:hypothetical protein
VNDLGILALNGSNAAPGGASFGALLAAMGLPATSVPEPLSTSTAIAAAALFTRRRRRLAGN